VKLLKAASYHLQLSHQVVILAQLGVSSWTRASPTQTPSCVSSHHPRLLSFSFFSSSSVSTRAAASSNVSSSDSSRVDVAPWLS